MVSAGMCKHFSILQMKMKRVSSGNLEPMATDCNYQDRGDEIGFLNLLLLIKCYWI